MDAGDSNEGGGLDEPAGARRNKIEWILRMTVVP